MSAEIEFEKYKNRSSDYHYEQISKRNIRNLNAYTLARYSKHIKLIYSYLLKNNYNKTIPINILDIGCGDGVLLFLLQKQITKFKFDISGVDLSEDALKTANLKLPNGNFKLAGAYETPFDTDYFDLVISSDVIEHVQYPEKMIAEIKKVAKKQALIIIGTPIRYTEKPLDEMHVHEFFQQEFIDLLSKSLKVIELVESHKLLHYLKYIKQSIFLRIRLFRYLYNFLCLLGKNPFMQTITSIRDFPTYMYAICENSRN